MSLLKYFQKQSSGDITSNIAALTTNTNIATTDSNFNVDDASTKKARINESGASVLNERKSIDFDDDDDGDSDVKFETKKKIVKKSKKDQNDDNADDDDENNADDSDQKKVGKSAFDEERDEMLSNAKSEQAKLETRRQRYSFLINPRDENGNHIGTLNYDPSTVFIPQSVLAAMSAFEKQYWDIKKKNFDVIIFFRKGKFFELFEDDADLCARLLGLRVTNRGSMRLAGVPVDSFVQWAKKLVEKGYKVGRVDELETRISAEKRKKAGDDGGGGKVMQRQLCQIITAGTLIDESFLSTQDANNLLAIVELLPTNAVSTTMMSIEFGICIVDCSIGDFQISTLTDDNRRMQLQTMLLRSAPREVVYYRSALSTATLHMINRCLKGVQITIIDELPSTFSSSAMSISTPTTAQVAVQLQFVKSNFFPSVELPLAISQSSTRMLDAVILSLGYLRRCIVDDELIAKGRFAIDKTPQRNVTIDGQTLLNLEILTNSTDQSRSGSLLELIDRTSTAFGKRLFTSWLCHPLNALVDIEARLTAVDDLLIRPSLRKALMTMLSALADLERLLSRLRVTPQSVSTVAVCSVGDFVRALKSFESIDAFFSNQHSLQALIDDVDCDSVQTNNDTSKKQIQSSLLIDLLSVSLSTSSTTNSTLRSALDSIRSMFDFRAAENENEIIPVAGIDADFDRCVQIVSAYKQEIEQQRQIAQDLFQDNTIAFADTTQIKYQIQIKNELLQRTQIPTQWTMTSETKQVKRFHTPDIAKILPLLAEAQDNLKLARQGSLLKILARFDNYRTTHWSVVVSRLATLDCLLSLAIASSQIDGAKCRPKFIVNENSNDDNNNQYLKNGVLNIRQMRHPCLVSRVVNEFIPNDISLGVKSNNDSDSLDARLILLTGPNMGGKSTIMRQVCIHVIMAQIGCYVPAAFYECSLFDRIFTRVGAQDIILAGQSTFMVELEETSAILRYATSQSLVMIDELGRGTSTCDGFAIAYSALRHLAERIRCPTIFSTHYHLLTDEFAHSPFVRLMHMSAIVDDAQKSVTFLYKLVAGVCPKSYGMHVARMANVPESVVEEAERVSSQLETVFQFAKLAKRTN